MQQCPRSSCVSYHVMDGQEAQCAKRCLLFLLSLSPPPPPVHPQLYTINVLSFKRNFMALALPLCMLSLSHFVCLSGKPRAIRPLFPQTKQVRTLGGPPEVGALASAYSSASWSAASPVSGFLSCTQSLISIGKMDQSCSITNTSQTSSAVEQSLVLCCNR